MPLAPRQHRRGGQALRERVRGLGSGGQAGGANRVRDRKQLDELQAEALKYLVEVLTEDEKNTAADAYAFLQKVGGDRFAGKVVKALAETFYDQSHYERGIEAYELLLKLDPTSRDAGEWVLQIASGYFTIEDYAHLKTTYERALAGYTAGGAWSRTQADPANVAATAKKIEQDLREHARRPPRQGAARQDEPRGVRGGGVAVRRVPLAVLRRPDRVRGPVLRRRRSTSTTSASSTEAATHYEASPRARCRPRRRGSSPAPRRGRMRSATRSPPSRQVRADEFAARKGSTARRGETETDKRFAEALDLYAELYPTPPTSPSSSSGRASSTTTTKCTTRP